MASATYLQSLDSVYEDGTSRGITPSNRRQIESFIPSEVIVINDLVALDFTPLTTDGDMALYVVQADNATISQAAIGFALEGATAADVLAGKAIKVTIAGIHESANVAGATAAGDRLKIGPAAGQAAVYVGGDNVPIVAIATEADTANVATVFVIKQF
jgi:hypothetical protein